LPIGECRPMKLLNYSALSEVEAETRRIVEAGKRGGGYIFNAGEGIPRQIGPEAVQTMIRTAKRWEQYAGKSSHYRFDIESGIKVVSPTR